MNKRVTLILVIFVMLLMGSILIFLNRNKSVVHAVSGYPFNLSFGQKAIVEPNQYAEEEETFSVTFLDILEDSRCPRDVTCTWEGRVVIAVEIHAEDFTSYYNLTQEGSRKNLEPVLIDPHATLRLVHVDPYPVSTKTIDKRDYVALLSLTDA